MKVILSALLLLVAGEAQAASERVIRRDCTMDALTYCAAAVPKGRAAIIRCMVANKNSLSEQCRQHIR